jgi:arabinofuranan 3-O-arabinosyltransferase
MRAQTSLRPRVTRPSLRNRLIPGGLGLAAYILALLQRPGDSVADTKIDLHNDPAGFLADVASVWSDSGGFGQVQAGQYSGYLFPMGPFFAALRELGLAPWLVQRLWLGTLLALAAWGTVRLLDALLSRRRGVAHLLAGAVVLLNPYVVVFANRTSVTLLGYAALPWLLLAVHRGVRDGRRWWWPAAFALIVTATGGGVNAAVTALVLIGPLLFALYEGAFGGVGWGRVGSFAARTAALSLAASLWWIVPVAAHARYGLNFLPFTESPGAIWDTTGLSETLRLMGYWISYLGTGYGARLHPYFDTSGTLLFEPLPLVASLLLPALALGGFAWTRRWRYGPFFLALALVGALVMSAGFPEGSPLRRALTFGYNHAEAAQFLRTTYKAGPLVALGLAGLAGAAGAQLAGRLRPPARVTGGVAAAALLALGAWPLVSGTAIDRQIAYELPESWRAAAADIDRSLPRETRALVLPGQLFPFYRWGGTQDPILPALSERPVVVRSLVPYSDLRAAELLYTLDSLVQQHRVLPGQLPPLLRLAGVGAVVTGSDDDPVRSGAIAPAAAARQLDVGGLPQASRAYGPLSRHASAPGELEPSRRLPQVRRADIAGARPLVRVQPLAPELVVDGSAEGLAGLAALEALPGGRTIRYAADLAPDELRRAAARGAEVVISDSNRRRVFVASRPRQSSGAVLGPEDPISEDGAVLNPFAGRGTVAQTVALYEGARSIRSPFSPGFPQFPEHRPYAAFDGSPRTFWVADRNLDRPRHWVQIEFPRPRDVPFVELLPQRESRTDVTAVELAGRRFPVRPGWNRLRLDLRRVRSLRVRITAVRSPDDDAEGAGAIAEVRLPGLRVRERLRPPLLAARALRGRSLEAATLTVLLARVTGDDTYRRSPAQDPGRGFVAEDRNREAALVSDPGDAEAGLSRVLTLPAARSFELRGLASAAPDAPDEALDRLSGYRGAVRFGSSGRYQGVPGRRASSAFDGDPRTAWVGHAPAGARPWIAWTSERPLRVERLGLRRAGAPVPAPARVRLWWPGGRSGPLRVAAGGAVRLPRPVHARSFRLEVLARRPPPRGAGAVPAVGIAELRVPGLRRARIPRRGPVRGRCSLELRAGGRLAALRPAGAVADLDAGRPLRALGCGRPLALPAGRVGLDHRAGVLRLDLLRLRSPAPSPRARTAVHGRVVDPGTPGRGRREDVRLSLPAAAWLVLGESYNEGWRAWCDGQELGPPEPVDGYANGWRAPRGCSDARFAFAPNASARWGYAISAVVALALLCLLVLRRRAGAAVPPAPGALPDPDPPRPWSRGAALAAGAVLTVPLSFVLSIRAGLLLAPAIALLLWRGVSTRALALAAGALLGIAVPLLYLVLKPPDRGGFNSEYALDLIAAHWVAVAAVALLLVALARTLAGVSRARAPSDARAASPAAAAGRRSPP